mgnify:CR=1 FL=1|tara:strand:+ start:4926 stop:5690 length:765 start_codon:yes stop_codon:yes gene_type:complete
MKVVILAGGYGTRLSEYTDTIPKPMVQISGKPILEHIMNIYSKYLFKDFFIALGYKSAIIKEYFLNYKNSNSDFQINLKTGKINPYRDYSKDWSVNLINTGQNSMTGGRILRLKEYLTETFFLTYGDAVCDIDINELLKFHKLHKKLVTITAVRPPARFGELNINNKNLVTSFKEKPQVNEGWINGGFFVMEPEFLNFIENDQTILEKEPLELASQKNELVAFKHEGFWQCMDTKRDKDNLEKLINNEKAPWLK